MYYKCRICGRTYDFLEDVIDCEQKCLQKEKDAELKEQNERFNKDLIELNKKKNDLQKIIDFIKGNIEACNERLLEYQHKLEEKKNELKNIMTQIESLKNNQKKEYEKPEINISSQKKELTSDNDGDISIECFINGEKVEPKDFLKNFDKLNEFLNLWDNEDLF